MNKHAFLMIIGCLLPLLLIFLLPLFGISGGSVVLIFVVLMLLCHLLMPMHYGGDRAHEGHSAGEKR